MRRRDFLSGASCAVAAGLLPRSARAGGDSLLVESGLPQNLATPLEYFDRLITPTPVFFVRSHFGAPAIDTNRRLKIEGKKALDLGAADLRRFKQVKAAAVLECAGNSRGYHRPTVPGVQWTHGAMSQGEWGGVRLKDVLESAGVPEGAAWIKVEGGDLPPHPKVPRFIRGLPIARAMDETTMIATHLNKEPLPHPHGAPMRLVVPGWTGNHWVKWLKSIVIQKDPVTGFFMENGYRMPGTGWAKGQPLGPTNSTPVDVLALRSVIAKPNTGGKLKKGAVEIAGVAFSGDRPIAKVEVSIDGGATWVDAKLEGAPGPGRWQVFKHRFDASPGAHTAVARATDDKGNAQPKEASWNPSGYLWNGWHEVQFEVIG